MAKTSPSASPDGFAISHAQAFALKPFEIIGKNLIALWSGSTGFIKFIAETFFCVITPPFRGKETMLQLYSIGAKSMPVIVFCVSFAAAVTISEYAYHMKLLIQSASMVPGFAALLILRELGAVLTALLLTSRVGAGIAAEVGTMQITEQIDALRLLNVDPIRFLVVPRFIATIFSSMALAVFANATCLFFAMVVSISEINSSPGSFLTAMNVFTKYTDFTSSIIKAGVFGAVIPLISCFNGFRCKAGAEGVGRATTTAVVTNAVTIIILDFILTYIFSYFY